MAQCVVCGKEFKKRGPKKTCGKECALTNKHAKRKLLYHSNQEFHARFLEQQKKYRKNRQLNDPEYYEKMRERSRAWYLKNTSNPVVQERMRKKRRESWHRTHPRRKDDPIYRERLRAHGRKYQRARYWSDLAYRKRQSAYARLRYAENAEFRSRCIENAAKYQRLRRRDLYLYNLESQILESRIINHAKRVADQGPDPSPNGS